MKDLKQMWNDPPKEYRPVPFWSWNEKLDTKETAWQIEQMDKAGLGGYFMHARGGLQTAYMEDEWMDNVRCGLAEGQKRGMSAWGYDENGWPSGFGGGLVNGLGLKYQQKYLRYERTKDARQTDSTICNLPYEGENLHFYYEVNPFYVDTLDAEVIAKFIEVTHEQYLKTLGPDFQRMAGFFTDEPQISRNGIPWSLVLPQEYQKRYGEELLPSLSALFFETEGFEQVRFRFWQLVRDLFTDAFMKQIYDWCNANGSRLTGHMVLEETMESQIASNGACMPSYEFLHIPGIDWLGRSTGPSTGPVQVASVAAQLGKKQVLSESFALCGWDVSFEELRWVLEWQLVRGVNLLCPHLEGYSLRGIRKRDYPATLFYQQPWWGEYKTLNDYFSRIGMLLSEGEIHFRTLVLHPMASAWLCFNNGDNGRLRELDEKLASLLTALDEAQIPYHLGDERILARHGSISGKHFQVGQQTYDVVLVPDALVLSEETVSLLEKYSENGGLVIFAGTVPCYVDGKPSGRLAGLAARSVVCTSHAAAVAAVPRQADALRLSGGEHSGVVSTIRRFADDTTFYYIVNTAKEPRSFTAQFNGRSVRLLDALSGEILPVAYQMHEDAVVSVDISLPGMGSVLLLSSPDKQTGPAPLSKNSRPLNGLLKQEWTLAESDPNALTLDFCDCWFDGKLVEENCPVNNIQEMACDLLRPVDIDLVFHVAVGSLPRRPLYLVLETPEKFSLSVNGRPIEMTDCGYYRDKSFRKIPLGDSLRVGENELRLSIHFTQRPETYKNIQNSLMFESEKNKLTYDTEIEAVYLIGEFGIAAPGRFTELDRRGTRYSGQFALTDRPETLRCGNVIQQGFPFFNGRMLLKQTVTLTEEECKDRKLVFSDRCSTVTRVYVNGVQAGTVLWQPYEVELGDLLRPGENEIAVEIIGNLRNLLGPHHLEEGECYAVCPSSFFRESKVWCGGTNPAWNDDYCFVRYGLFLQDK